MTFRRTLSTLLSAFIYASCAFSQTQINDLNVTDSVLNLSATGNVCVNTYVYDLGQPSAPAACCSTLLSSTQQYYLSGQRDLINNLITRSMPPSVLVKVSASVPTGAVCSPAAPGAFAPGLTVSLGTIPGGTGTPIPQVTPSANDINVCNFILANGSGLGVCGQARNTNNVVSAPSLTIAKTHSGSFRPGQAGAQYTLTVSNSAAGGPSSGLVTVTDTLPASLALVSMSGTGWSCNANVCTRSDVLGTGASYPPVIVVVNVAADASSPQINTASVSGGGAAGGTITDPTAIDVNSPGIEIDNLNSTDSVLNFSAKANVCVNTYVFDVSQQLLACCSSLISSSQQFFLSSRQDLISNPVTPSNPASILVKLSASAVNGGACNPGLPGVPVGGLITSIGAAPGDPGVPFPQLAPTAFDATKCSFIRSNSGGFGICGNARSLSSAGALPLLGVSKTHLGSFTQGQAGATYTVTVTNSAAAGPSTGTVTVTETVPAGLTLVSMAGSGWTCVTNVCSRSDSLDTGGVYPAITVKVNVVADAASPVVNAVTVSGGGSVSASASDSTIVISTTPADPGTAIGNLNNADSVVNFTPSGNVCVNSYVFNESRQLIACCATAASASQSYYQSVRNDLIINPATAATPSSIFLKLSASAQGAGICDPSRPGAGLSTLAASFGPSAGAAGMPIQLTSPTTADQTACAFILSNGSGFGVCKQARPFSLANYSLSLGSGQAAAGKLVELPIQLTAVSATATSFQSELNFDQQKLSFVSAHKGEALTAAGKDVSIETEANGDVRVASTGSPQTTIGNGNLAFVTFQLNSQFTSGSTPVNMKNCLVSAGGVLLTAACTGGAVTVQMVPAVLSIIKTHSGSFTQGQMGAAYTLTVSSAAGSGSTSGPVTVTETVPSGLTLVSMSGTGWACTGNTCTRTDVLTPGSSYPFITVTVNVAAGATSPQVNTASVSGGGAANASVSDSTTINPSGPAIVLPASVSVNPGDQIAFPVRLSAPAPVGGVFITLSLSDPSVASLNTVNVFISEGDTVSNRARLNGLAVGSTTILASAHGFATASTQVVVGGGSSGGGGGENPPAIILPANVSLNAGDQLQYPISLSVPAGPSGVFITLTISNPAVASFNTPNALIGAGDTVSNRIRLNGNSPGTATVTASAPGYPTVTQQVQVVSR